MLYIVIHGVPRSENVVNLIGLADSIKRRLAREGKALERIEKIETQDAGIQTVVRNGPKASDICVFMPADQLPLEPGYPILADIVCAGEYVLNGDDLARVVGSEILKVFAVNDFTGVVRGTEHGFWFSSVKDRQQAVSYAEESACLTGAGV